MTDRGLVIEGLEEQLDDLRKYAGNDELLTMTQERAKEIVALLKQQEPVEPRKIHMEPTGHHTDRCFCRKCGNPVGIMVNGKVTQAHSKYCDQCGQAVKWT